MKTKTGVDPETVGAEERAEDGDEEQFFRWILDSLYTAFHDCWRLLDDRPRDLNADRLRG